MRKLYFFLLFVVCTAPIYGQTVTLSLETNGVAGSPLLGGSTNRPVFGVKAAKSGGGTASITGVTISLSQNPTGKFLNPRIYTSTDNVLDVGDTQTAGSFASNTIVFTGTPLTDFGGGSGPANRWFFIVVDIDPAVDGSTLATMPTLINANVASGATVSGGPVDGTNFLFTALNTTIAKVTGGVVSPIVGAQNNRALIGLSALTNAANGAAQNLSQVVFTLDIDPTDVAILSNYRLIDNGTTSTYTPGSGSAVGTVSTDGTLKTVTVSSINVAMNGSLHYFFLAADVPVSVANGSVTSTLTSASASAGYTTGTGFNQLINIQALQTTIVQSSSSIATSFVGGNTNQVILAFRATTNGTQTLNNAVFTLTIDPTDNTLLKNYRLINNGSTNTYTSGGGTSVGTLVANGGTKTLTYSTIGVALSASNTYFFLVADVDATAAAADGNETTTFTSASCNQGSTNGTPFSQGPIAFDDLRATLANITAAPVISGTVLEAGQQNQVLAGFSIVSNGIQTLDQVNFALTAYSGKLSGFELFKSSSAGSVGASIKTSADGTFGSLGQTINGSTLYFYLVADVDNMLTTATPSTAVVLTQAGVVLTTGTTTSLNINRTFTYTASQSTSISVSNNGQTTLDLSEYSNDESVLANVTNANSQAIFAFDISDNDSDGHSTTITQLNFSLTNFDNLATISIFDGSTNTKIGISQVVSGSAISFSSLSFVVPDGTPGTKTVTVRVTFHANVDDNETIGVTLTGATASASGSGLASFSGIQTGAGKNRIDVNATRIIFVDALNAPFTGLISAYVSPQPGSTFSATAAAVDSRDNIDIDETSSVSLNITPSAGVTFTGGAAAALSGGKHTYSSLTINMVNTYSLGASDGGAGLVDATSGNGTAATVEILSLGAAVAAANLTSCPVGSGAFFNSLPNLVITEQANSDFATGNNLTFLMILPTGWEFQTSGMGYSPPTISYTPAKNITSASFNNFIGTTIAKFIYSVNNTNMADAITISGLKVKNVNAGSAASIFRSGTGVIDGVDDSKSLGTLTPGGGAAADFTVQASPNQPAVGPTETNFSVSSAAIILRGEVPPGTQIDPVADPNGAFTGQGVSYRFVAGNPINANRWTFNPGTLDVGTYPINYTYTNASTGCISTASKTFSVFSSIINGLQSEYCVDNSTAQSLTVNPSFFPAGYDLVNFSFSFPSSRTITDVINNGSSLTLTVPSHGFTNGTNLSMFIGYGFSGPSAPFGYVNGSFTISNVTPNTFDIPAVVIGSWNHQYGYVYITTPTVTNVTNNITSMTFTMPGHGLKNGDKIYAEVQTTLSGYLYGWYTVSAVTANTFNLNIVGLGSWTGYAYVDLFDYQISTFYPNMAGTLNSNWASTNNYNIGFVVRQTGCPSCDQYIWSSALVTLNPLPSVDFNGLAGRYCVNDNAIYLLTGNQADGEFSVIPNFGLADHGTGNNSADFRPNTSGITVESPISIQYAFTDSHGCTNTINKNTVVHALPIVSAGPNVPVCIGSGAIIGGSPTASGNGPFDFVWDNAATMDNSASANPKASPVVNTDYLVTVTDAYGCVNSATTQVTVNALPTVDAGPASTSICSGGSVNLTTLGANFGGTASSASWASLSSIPGEFRDVSDVTISPPAPFGTAVTYVPSSAETSNGSVVLRLTTNDPAGPCTPVFDDIVVSINTVASANAGTNQVVCSGNQIILNGSVGGAATSGTWSSNGGGTIVSPSSLNTEYLPSALELQNGGTITLTLTTDDPPGVCPATTNSITADVHQRALIDAGIDIKKCANETILLAGSISPNSSASSTTWTGGLGTFSPNATNRNAEYIPDPSELNGIDIVFTLTSNDPDGTGPTGPCPAETDQVGLKIVRIPDPPGSASPSPYCENDAIAPLSAIGSGLLTWYDDPGLTNSLNTGPNFISGVQSDAEKIVSFYVTQTVDGCESSSTSVTIAVNPLPVANFSAANFCFGEAMSFTDASMVSNSTIATWAWRFGDGDELAAGSGAIPPLQHNGRTFGQFDLPQHQYGATGDYAVQLTVMSAKGCQKAISQDLKVGPVPIADFDFNSLCEGGTTNFSALDDNSNAAIISTTEWNFGDPGSAGNNTSLTSISTHDYPGVGTYPVSLTLISNLGCQDDTIRNISILPYKHSFPYSESFESGTNGWVADGLNTNLLSSWTLTNPTGSVINSAALGSKAWITRDATLGTYNNNERSVLYGPCLDVTQVERPVLSFQYWDNTDEGNDGAYIEISTDGGNNWSKLGGQNEGINWYDHSSVLGLSQTNGVGQSIGQIGWSGDSKTTQMSNGWKTAAFNLDQFKSQTNLRIRVVFGSNPDNPDRILDGFAFDDFRVESRNRTILAENFTNLSDNGAVVNNTNFKNFLSVTTSDELVKVQYHTSIGGADPFNAVDKEDPNARAAFYGVTSSIQGYIDGSSGGSFSNTSWASSEYNSRSLVASPIEITASAASDPDGTFTVTPTIKAIEDIPQTNQYIILTAVVEKQVSGQSFVLRKLLPDATGIPLTALDSGDVQSFSVSTLLSNISDSTQTAVIVFAQELQNPKRVLQAYLLSNVGSPTITTGIETTVIDDIRLFPNPADNELRLQFSVAASEKTGFTLYDPIGHATVIGIFEKGDREKTIDTRNLAAGLYLLHISNKNGVMVQKKVIIVHRTN